MTQSQLIHIFCHKRVPDAAEVISATTKLGLLQNIVSQLCCRRNRFRCVGASFLLYWQKIWINRDWITKFEKNPNAASADRPLGRNAVFEDSGTHRPTPRASWAQFLHSHHLRHQANPTSYKKNHVQIFFEDTISVIPKQWVLKKSNINFRTEQVGIKKSIEQNLNWYLGHDCRLHIWIFCSLH